MSALVSALARLQHLNRPVSTPPRRSARPRSISGEVAEETWSKGRSLSLLAPCYLECYAPGVVLFS